MLLVIKIIITIIALIFVYILFKTLKKYPILKAFKTHDSSKQWLKTTILDYYVQTLAFSIIVFSTEEKKIIALLWIILNSILGSPFAILYLLTKKKWSLQN
jgi:hypothetical protein